MDESDDELLTMVRRLVAKGRPTVDPKPSDIGGDLFVGGKHHAPHVATLKSLGVTVVLNCAPTGIRNLPLEVRNRDSPLLELVLEPLVLD